MAKGVRFKRAVARIAADYADLTLSDGWRFLYSPSKTLNRKTRIMFLTLLPMPDDPEAVGESNEKGNVLRIGSLPMGGSVLQREVQLLFREVAEASETAGSWEDLLDSALTLPLIPFRVVDPGYCPEWQDIGIATHALWDELLTFLRVDICIANGEMALQYLAANLNRADYGAVSSTPQPLSADGTLGWEHVVFFHPERPNFNAYVIPELEMSCFASDRRCAKQTRKLAAAIAKRLDNPEIPGRK